MMALTPEMLDELEQAQVKFAQRPPPRNLTDEDLCFCGMLLRRAAALIAAARERDELSGKTGQLEKENHAISMHAAALQRAVWKQAERAMEAGVPPFDFEVGPEVKETLMMAEQIKQLKARLALFDELLELIQEYQYNENQKNECIECGSKETEEHNLERIKAHLAGMDGQHE